MNIMLVEDDPYYQFILEKVLKEKGNEVVIVKDMTMFRDKIKGKPPALIIMDIILPERPRGREVTDGGIVLAKECRETRPEMPIIFLSIWSPGNFQERINIGTSEYLTKPVDFNTLFAAINKYINKTKE